jgi:hypothetical protein
LAVVTDKPYTATIANTNNNFFIVTFY